MAAEATLHQAVKAMLRFVQIRSERFETIDNAQGPDKNKAHDSVAAAADVSAQVLREIMVMCTPKSSERLKYRKSERGTGVALDVIQDILNTRASVMSKYPVLSDALEECVFPILLKQLQRIGAGTLRLLPREEQSAYASRVSMAVQYMNAVSSVVSNFPHALRVGKEDNSFLLSTVANMLSVLVTMAQEAKPSWVRLLALEVLHDFVTGPSLDYRIQQIFMLCRSYDEWDEGGSTENIIVSLAATFEALAVKLLDVPGSNAGEKADKVLISEKLVPAKGQKDKPLITLTRSLVLAPLESDAGRWTRGLEALKYGDLTSLGGGNDAVLTPLEIKKNKAARALLVERVRAEIAVVCGAQMMEAIGNLCGVVNWRSHSQNRHDTGLSVSTTNTAGSTTSKESISTTNVRGGDAGGVRVSAQPSMDAELMEVNAEACWHLMETCVPSLLNLSRVSIKSIDLECVLRSTMRAHSTITQTAAVLQIVHVRDSALENLCQMAEAGMQGIPGLDFGPTPSTASTTASNATAATAIASYVPAIWDWRRTLVTEELLGVILEVAAVMHEGWAKVLPVLQRLHFELSARVRLEKAHVAAAGALRVPVVRENSKDSKSSQDSKRLSANDVKNALEAPASPAKTSSTAEFEVMPVVEEFLPVADIGIPASALLASLEGLFCGSWCLPDKAVVALLNELGAQSRDCVVRTGESYPENGELEQAQSPTPPTVGNGRFGMEQTLVVVRHNFFRLNVLWGALSNQLAQMLAHQRASMRTYGAQCYTEISLEALTFLSGHELLKKEAVASQLDAELCASTERSIADSYLQMYTNSSFSDMRRALLVGLQALLQACKSKTIRISTGWQSLLNLLMIVPKQESEPIQLREASECLKVICESLLSYVPVEDMENLAKCLETMGSQDTDQKSAEGAMSVLVDLASFLTANRVPLIARLVGHGASSTLASPPSVLSEKELQVRTAVQEKAASILELLIGKVLTSLLSLGLDRRVKVREEALQGLFSLLTTDAYFSEPARLMLTCRHKLLAFLDAVAQHVESAEEDGSLCWQHWLATWLSVVQGTALLLETGMTALYCHTQPEQQALDVEKENVGLVDGLAAWEGINTRLGVALTCGNMFVVRAAIKAITVPLARVGDQIPRAAWDVVWEKMPQLLAAAQQKSETKSPSGRRQLPGPMLASVVVEELMELCEKPSVQRGCTSLAGQASLVSVGNLSSLTSLVAAATSDFRTTSPEAPVSGKADTRETPETRRQQATRLYTVLVQAACERNQSEAEEVWHQVMWSLLRHLPGRPSLDYSWGADITVPDKFAPLPNGIGCADMAANLLALLLLNEAPSYILRVTVEPVSVGMLLAMCGRYSGVVFREWRAVTAAFVVVLFASIKILNREQDETDINGDESPALPRHSAGKEQERRIRVVRRLTGGIKSFLLPPDGYQVSVEPAPAPKKSAPKTGVDKVLTKRGPDTEEDAAVAEIESSVVQALIKHVIPRAEEPEVRKDLLLLLDTIVGASCSGAGGKDLLARSCLEGLLALAEAQQTDSELGETEDVQVVDPSKSELDVVNLAAKVAVERCRDVLESYLSYEIAVEEAQSRKDKINGQVNPVKSLELAVTAIHGLEKLRIYPATFDFLLQNLEVCCCSVSSCSLVALSRLIEIEHSASSVSSFCLRFCLCFCFCLCLCLCFCLCPCLCLCLCLCLYLCLRLFCCDYVCLYLCNLQHIVEGVEELIPDSVNTSQICITITSTSTRVWLCLCLCFGVCCRWC